MTGPQRPVAADMLLGHARTRGAQVIKQADVLMLHYLVPDEVAPGSLAPNLDFYEPRTAHGSSLSPGVHAALLARVGRLDEDLAAMGSVWRALSFGFAGLRPVGDALVIDPVLAPGWESLELRVRFRGSRVRLLIRPDGVEARADPPVQALTAAGQRVELTPATQIFEPNPTRPRSYP